MVTVQVICRLIQGGFGDKGFISKITILKYSGLILLVMYLVSNYMSNNSTGGGYNGLHIDRARLSYPYNSQHV